MVKKWTYILMAAGAVVAGVAFFFPNHHPHFFWQKLPVFDTLFGIAGCLVLIIVAESLGHYWLQKGEDYYDN